MIKRRNTPQKQMILSLFNERQAGLCQDEIEKLMEHKMDKVTIYRILNRFCEDGLMHKITGENGKSYFALEHHSKPNTQVADHYHFHCEMCNQMLCLYDKVKIELDKNFTIFQTNCVITGICPQCKK